MGSEEFLNHVMNYPNLTPEEEVELFRRYKENDDQLALDKIIMSHMKYVRMYLKKFGSNMNEIEDLMQEGAIGIKKAAEKFDPQRDARFITICMLYVKNYVFEYFFKHNKQIRTITTKPQRKLYYKLRDYVKDVYNVTEKEIKKVSKELDITESIVREYAQNNHLGERIFLSIDSEDDDENTSIANTLQDHFHLTPDSYLMEKEENANLKVRWNFLDDRTRAILEKRYMGDTQATLMELSEEFGVSAERIRQIEKVGINKLKQGVMQ